MSICPQAMSYLRPSSESDLVSPVMACLVDVYGAEFGRGAWAEIEPLLMMRPPRGDCSFICRNAACAHRNEPVRLMSTTLFHCSRVRSSNGPPALMPALLNSRSTRPKRSVVAANSARTEPGSATSVGTASGLPASVPASRIACSSGSRRRPASATRQP